MDVTSMGYRSDLALLRLGGSELDDRGDHLVVRTPHNPSFWWGNFLLLEALPSPTEAPWWLDTFCLVFPAAKHVAIGFDGVGGTVADLAGFAAAGLTVEASTVMTANAVHPPPHADLEASYRILTSDADWAQHVELRVVCRGETAGSGRDRQFFAAKAATMRGLVDAGHGAWFGAFLDGQLVSSMGLFLTESGVARFQSVETHPDMRGRGFAGTLVHAVGRYGFTELGAHTLVIVADPDDSAIRLYRRVGFADSETQLQAERPPVVTDG